MSWDCCDIPNVVIVLGFEGLLSTFTKQPTHPKKSKVVLPPHRTGAPSLSRSSLEVTHPPHTWRLPKIQPQGHQYRLQIQKHSRTPSTQSGEALGCDCTDANQSAAGRTQDISIRRLQGRYIGCGAVQRQDWLRSSFGREG